MSKPFVKLSTFFVGVVKKVTLTEKGGADLMQVTIEIPRQAWADSHDLADLRGSVASFKVDTIRLVEAEDTDVRAGILPGRVTQ